MNNHEAIKINRIREQYVQTEKTKFDELKELDKKVKRPAEIFGYAFGSAGALVLGTGMCFAMKIIGEMMILGIAIGMIGIAMVSVNYSIYKAILKSRRKKYSSQIFALTDSLLNK